MNEKIGGGEGLLLCNLGPIQSQNGNLPRSRGRRDELGQQGLSL